MESRIIKYAYEGQEIEFDVSNPKLMVNATEMAKIFDKDVYDFTRRDGTKAFIASCLKPAFAGLLDVKIEDDLIVSSQKAGTWMHRVLALKYAASLDSDFEVWVYITIDQILRGQGPVKEEDTAERKDALSVIQQETDRIEAARKRIQLQNQEDQRIIEEATQNIALQQKRLSRLNKVVVNQLNIFATGQDNQPTTTNQTGHES